MFTVHTVCKVKESRFKDKLYFNYWCLPNSICQWSTSEGECAFSIPQQVLYGLRFVITKKAFIANPNDNSN